jgi:pimeloyl-ACP methyl ester carboxylesterase
MSTIKTQDGTQIYYKDWGAGKPVLFSHGWPLDGDMWDSQLNFLAERGYRVIAFDRRGLAAPISRGRVQLRHLRLRH